MQVEALTDRARLDLPHLSRRFLQVVRARPLTPAEQDIVAGVLRPTEVPLFWAQSPADRRHGFETMQRAARRAGSPEVLRAALLHDVGKSGLRLGPLMRSLATVLDAWGAPLSGRLRAYRTHGARGAALLAAAGAEPLIVDFARRHPDPDPGQHDPADWDLLLESDDV